MSDGANRISAIIEKNERMTPGSRVVATRDHSTGNSGPESDWSFYFAGWRGTVQPRPPAVGVSFVVVRWDDQPDWSRPVDIDNVELLSVVDQIGELEESP